MKNPRFLPAFCLGAAALLLPPTAHVARAGDWVEVSRKGDLVVYNRERTGSDLKEVKGVGTINAPNWAVKNVIDDAEHYTEFMPYMKESRVLKRDPAAGTTLAYAKLKPPMISPRDYTLLVHDESKKNPDGTVTYKNRWEAANDQGPKEQEGVSRVKVTDGYWLLEPADGGKKTKATYLLYTDGGGGVPSFLANQVNKTRVGELFDVVGKKAQESKYQQKKPSVP